MNVSPPAAPGRDGDAPLFRLLRLSLGIAGDLPPALSPQEWASLYGEAKRHSVVGQLYTAIERLPIELWPPLELAMQWANDAETVRSLNLAFNAEAGRLTRFFASEGRRTAILKGQANARLYPEAGMRQPGDIDIWVEGGQERVTGLLRKHKMLDEGTPLCYHHAHLRPDGRSISVEVHYRPSSDRHPGVQEFLNTELSSLVLCDEGFYVPSVRFSLVMQLAHIRTHLIAGGIGLRQLVDYYLLLCTATHEERRDVADRLRSLRLHRTAEALMWLLGEVLGLDEAHMLLPPSERRGRWMLKEVMAKGNFGMHSNLREVGTWQFFLCCKRRKWELFRFEPERGRELLREELRYWKRIVTGIPLRIKYRSLSLRNHPEAWSE